MDLLLRAAEVDKKDVVLEVGTGTGSLTQRLAEAAAAVVSVEVDRDFHALGKEAVRRYSNTELLCCDILESKNRLNPEVMSSFERHLKETGTPRFKLVANLPYVVATPSWQTLLLSAALRSHGGDGAGRDRRPTGSSSRRQGLRAP